MYPRDGFPRVLLLACPTTRVYFSMTFALFLRDSGIQNYGRLFLNVRHGE